MTGSERVRRGMVLGKFMPPHHGHRYLVDFARHFSDELYVVVGTLASEPIPGRLRFEWMQQLFPECHVLHLEDELPQAPEEHEEFWALWRRSLRNILPSRIDHVFASEDYGRRLAEELDAAFVPVDRNRSALPISGTRVREDPLGQWAYLPPCVRPYFARRVSIFGPESTGKSTLTAKLAERFGGAVVPEYAREFIEGVGRELELRDMVTIARGQAAAESHLVRASPSGLVFCDTDPLVTPLWSRELFGEVEPELMAVATDQRYALTLLLDVDVPWVDDVHRYRPEGREGFYAACQRALEAAGRPYTVIHGTWSEREARACAAVERLLAQSGR